LEEKKFWLRRSDLNQQEHCRRKAIHSADFAFLQLPIATRPEDSFSSVTAVQEETYAT
jgi:hypothetical protein